MTRNNGFDEKWLAEYQARQKKPMAVDLPDLPTPEQCRELRGKHGIEPKRNKSRQPNKTETEYAFRLGLEFPGCKVKFEAITLHLENGHAYTADWVVVTPEGISLLVEVKARGKNGFRHPSYQRARVMFDQSRVEYPFWSFRWAEKSGGTWDEKEYTAKLKQLTTAG